MELHDSVEQRFTVYTYDIDYAGHVSNIVYLRWLENLRYALLERYLPLYTLIEKGYLPVVARSEVQYLKPVYLFEAPQGRLWVSKIGLVKSKVKATFTVEGELRAEASHDITFLSRDTMRPVKRTLLVS